MLSRVLGVLLGLLVSAALLVVGWPQLFQLEQRAGMTQIISFRLVAALAVGAVAVVAVLFALASRTLRRFLGLSIVAGLIFAVATGGLLAVRGFSGTDPQTASDITVLSWNTEGGSASPATISALANREKASVIVLPETTQKQGVDIAQRMRAYGRPMWVHTRATSSAYESRSTTILIAASLGQYRVDDAERTTTQTPSLVARPVSGSGPTFVAVHTVSPRTKTQMTAWRESLAWVQARCEASNTIVAGDFNATVDHMTSLVDASKKARSPLIGRCSDALLEAHTGAVGTWPTDVPALLGAPIDHVAMTSGWKATGAKVIVDEDKAGSDHRPVVATLSKDS